MKKYLTRTIEKELTGAVKDFPVVILTGPRQTGKSTTLKHIFPDYKYLTLDSPQLRSFAKDDPALFLENYGEKVIIDEIQYAPEILPYIKMNVDNDRSVNGRYILTGSQYFSLMSGVTESLAGRASIHELLGLSISELLIEDINAEKAFQLFLTGFYPDPAVQEVNVTNFYSSYLQTYLERDIRDLLAVHNLTLFQNFLELLAARVGSLLNLNEIAKECGISFPTARNWLSLLESTRIVYLLRPYHKNISKRVIKSPKLYFTDTGLLSYILRYQTYETLRSGPFAGSIFENFIVIELLKKRFNNNLNFELYHFRDSNKNEIDIVIEKAGRFILLEIKLTKTPRSNHVKHLKNLMPAFTSAKGFLLSFSEENLKISDDISFLYWKDFLDSGFGIMKRKGIDKFL